MATSSNTFTNGILEESKSIVSDLNSATQNFVNYLPLVFTIFGFIGFIGNAFTYLQPELRSNTCCIYSLCGSIVDIINLFINLFPYYLNFKYKITIPWNSSSFLCKFNYFLLGFLPHLPINFLIMAIIDRFACTCSLGSPLRRLNQLKMVPLVIVIAITISCLVSLRGPLLFELTSTFICVNTQPTTSSIVYIILNGLSPPIVMLIFVFLTYQNVRRSRQRVGGTNEMNKREARKQFIMMIFAQIIMTALISLQWVIVYAYNSYTTNEIRTADQSAIVRFVYNLSNFCFYLNYVKSFYISMLTSKLFKKTLIKGIINVFPRRIHHRFEMTINVPAIRPQEMIQ